MCKSPRIAALSIAALSLMASAAHADLKVVTLVTLNTNNETVKQATPDLTKPVTTTTYYKGNKQRVEGAGKDIIITNFETGSMTFMDPEKKTFYSMNLKEMSSQLDNPMLAMLKIDATADVKPGGQTKTISGKEAKNYKYTATMKMGMDGADAAMSAMFPTIIIKGEQWTTEAVTLPIDTARLTQQNMTRMVPPILQKGMKPFVDKMAAIKGFPLSSVVTVEFTFPKGSPGVPGMPKEPMVTTNEVKEISEAPLEDSLFTVPEGYKEVKPPTGGMIPGVGAPGGAGGATPPGTP